MSGSKHIDRICVLVSVLALILTILFMNGEVLGVEAVVVEDAEANSGSARFTANDLDGSWDSAGAVEITLDGSGGTVSGSGAYFLNGSLIIARAGRYVLSGRLDDGCISVDAYDNSKVWLLLNGVEVSCSDNACLRVEQADKVFLTLAEGSENSFSSGASYSEDALEDNTGGAIFAHDDLTINGGGSLSVTAAYKHAIDANDSLVITGGTITLDSAGDAVHVNDAFNFRDADLTVRAGDDGIHSDTSVYIESGSILISECYEGIEALTIEQAGGDVTIYPADDGLNANGNSGGFGMMGFGGRGGFHQSEGGESATDLAAATQSAAEEETEAETWIRISGGTLSIVNENARDADGIDSNGSIYISGGTIRVSMSNGGGYAMDVGSESGGVMEISGGNLVGCGSSSMAEGFDSSSTQPSILYIYSAGAEAGTTVALEDSEGNVLLSYDAPCAFSAVNLSCPEMELGKTYLVVIGDNVEEITLTESSASFGDARSGGFGGTMNFGGMQPRSDFSGEQGSMGGRRGMGGGRRGQQGSSEEGGGQFTPPEGFSFGEDGEPPALPEGFSFGEDGERPTPPEGFDFSDGGGWPAMPEGFGDSAAEAAAETAAYGSEVWIWSGVSLAALLLGLGLAALYRRRTG